MRKMPQKMKLSRDEDLFLRCWMYDEVHFRQGAGKAKQLQLQHHVVPADLAILIAAAFPDPQEQESAGVGPPPTEAPIWPWSEEGLGERIAEAKAVLLQRRKTAPALSKG
jgi:hypothetical protein